jgi:predicted RNA binding protein YcfA (HicA-like mRNA interferase family)
VVEVPPVPGLPLAVATSSAGVSVPSLPTASNRTLPAGAALAGAARAADAARREPRREARADVKADAKTPAVAAPLPERMDTNIRVRELLPLLESRGWVMEARRGRGSHRIFTHPLHPDWGHLSIPNHGGAATFSAGLLRQVLVKARILQR